MGTVEDGFFKLYRKIIFARVAFRVGLDEQMQNEKYLEEKKVKLNRVSGTNVLIRKEVLSLKKKVISFFDAKLPKRLCVW